MRVCIIPEYPASLMTGGLQVQAEETHAALARLAGVEAELFNWSERRPLPDLYHFMGLPAHMNRITELARQAGRPYLCTLLFGGNPHPWHLRLAGLRHLLKASVLRQDARRRAIRGAAHIITLTPGDARAARTIYGLAAARVSVVPNGVADAFFTCPPEPWRSRHGDQPFILCVGAVQRRKQQALLLRVANAVRLPVVLIGPVLPGEHAYGEQVAVAARENATLGGRWIPGLAAADPLLMSAYGNCRLFVLLSQEETQPLSVLQALAARKPVLLGMADYVANEPFAGLPVVPTTNVETVAAALRRAWEEARPTALERSYSWHAVAEQLLALYRAAVGGHGGT